MYTGRDARQNADRDQRTPLSCGRLYHRRSGTCRHADTNRISSTILSKPFIEVLLYECVILQMRVRLAHAIDFRALARRKFFLGIKTPAPFE